MRKRYDYQKLTQPGNRQGVGRIFTQSIQGDEEMKTVTLTVCDESKFHLLINFLKEISFVRIKEAMSPDPADTVKTMKNLPESVLHPVMAENFRTFSRDELHDRQSFHLYEYFGLRFP